MRFLKYPSEFVSPHSSRMQLIRAPTIHPRAVLPTLVGYVIQFKLIVVGRCLFLRYVYKFSLLLTSNWRSNFGHAKIESAAKLSGFAVYFFSLYVQSRVRNPCLTKNALVKWVFFVHTAI